MLHFSVRVLSIIFFYLKNSQYLNSFTHCFFFEPEMPLLVTTFSTLIFQKTKSTIVVNYY